MQPIAGIDHVKVLLNRFEAIGNLLSTGAEVVNFSGDLFNVSGSTDDPPDVPGQDGSWKQLLKDKAGLSDGDSCYVTNVIPEDDSSHPEFSVGGHMTTDPEGNVEVGGICYLMPLCFWHNSTSRDGERFEHSETKMLKLTGYMEGELATTFELRRPSHEPFAMLYFDHADEQWKHQNLSKEDLRSIESESLDRVIFERSKGDQPMLYIKESTLPK